MNKNIPKSPSPTKQLGEEAAGAHAIGDQAQRQ